MTRPYGGASLLPFIALVAPCTVLTFAACDEAAPPRLYFTPPSCQELNLATLGPGDFTAQIAFGESCRDFRLHVPPAWSTSNEPLPLVIGLHGYGGNATDLESASGFSRKADEAGFLALYPQALGSRPAWSISPGDGTYGDTGLLRALVEQLGASPRLDRRRVYVTGFSMGGALASRAACELSDIVAAIAPVSGSYQNFRVCAPQRPVPIMAIHGGADTTAPLAGQPDYGWPPVHDWLAWWVVANSCDVTPARTSPAAGVTVETWGPCQAGTAVTLVVIDEQAHVWPRRDGAPPLPIDGADMMWAFLSLHRLPQ